MKLTKLAAVATLAAVTAAPAFAGSTTHDLAVSASVTGNCKFTTASSTLAFGLIDPTGTGSKTATSNIFYRCTKGTLSTAINSDDGLYESGAGAPRMRHATVLTEFLPYTIALTGTGQTGTGHGGTGDLALTVTGTILETSYVNAQSGAFADTLVLTVLP